MRGKICLKDPYIGFVRAEDPVLELFSLMEFAVV